MEGSSREGTSKGKIISPKVFGLNPVKWVGGGSRPVRDTIRKGKKKETKTKLEGKDGKWAKRQGRSDG